MEKLISYLMKFGVRFGSSSVYYLIVGTAVVLLAPLFILAVWVLLEMSGLMAQRTGVREGFWVFLITLANLHFALEPNNKFFKLAWVARNVLISVYLVNGVAMLWDARPIVFWVLLVGTVTHFVGLFIKKPARDTIYIAREKVAH